MKHGSRRSFLAAAAGLSVYGCSQPESGHPVADSAIAEPPMKLSLSVRVAESFSDKRNSEMTIDELIDLAQTFGYEALCMRASQLGTNSPAEQIAEARDKIDAADLKVSMVTGDFAVPSNNEEGPMLLRNITPYLDLADALGSDLIRVCMKKDEDTNLRRSRLSRPPSAASAWLTNRTAPAYSRQSTAHCGCWSRSAGRISG